MDNLVFTFRMNNIKIRQVCLLLGHQKVDIIPPMVINNLEGTQTFLNTEITGIGAGIVAELALSDGREIPDAGELLH